MIIKKKFILKNEINNLIIKTKKIKKIKRSNKEKFKVLFN